MKTNIHEHKMLIRDEFPNSTNNIFIIDLNEMRFIDISPPALLMLGYTKEELLVKIPQDVVFINETILPLFNRISSSKEQQRTIQTVYQRKDNSTIEVEAYICCLDLDDKGIYIIVNTAETGGSKNAESNFRFHATLFNSIPEAVVTTDANFCITSYNRYAQEMFGWKKEESINRYAGELTNLVYPNIISEEVQKALVEQGTWKGEMITYRKNGESFHATISIGALKDYIGNITGTVSIINDCTPEKMLGQALKNSTEHLEQRLSQETQELTNILERVSDGFMAFDSNWKYTYINKRAAEAINCNPKELIGTILWTEFSQSQDALRYQEYHRAMQEQKSIRLEAYVESIQKWFEEVLYPSPEGLSVYFQDITDKRNARLAIQKNEALYRKAQSMGKLGNWIIDISDSKVHWSDETYSLFGINKALSELDFDNYLSFVHPDDREILLQELEFAIKGTKSLDIVHRIILPDGSIRYMHSVAEMINDEAGRPAQLTGMIQDITAQKLTEEALLLSEKNYRLLFEENPVPLWMADAENSLFIDVNQAALAQYGYTKEEFVGMQSGALRLPKNEFAMHLQEQKGVSGKTTEFTTSHRKKGGEIIQVSVKASLIAYKGRKVWLISGRDITKDLLYDASLRESQKQLSLIFNSTQNAMGLLKVEGKEGLRFEAVNDALVKQISRNKEKVIGRLVNEIFDVDKYQLIISKYYKCLSSGVAQKFVAATQFKRGERLLHFTVLPIKDDNGKVVQLLGISEDITAQKKAENKLIDSEEKYRILFERSPLPKLIFEQEGLQILEVNVAATDLYGYSHEEFQNMSLFDIGSAERYDDLSEFFDGGVPESFVFNTIHSKKNGDLMNVTVTANDICYENKGARIVVIADRTEQERARDELITTTQNLRDLASHLQNIREEERTDIAREIHDELGQQLTGLKMDISWLGKKLHTENENIRSKINTSLELIDVTINTVRKIASQLRPSILDDLGLAEAIKWHSSEFSERTGTGITFDTDVVDSNLSPAISIALFRIYQESLTNVARHANATAVHSSLNIDGTTIILTINDNGTGFNKNEPTRRKTLGLLGMKERVTMLNGKYTIESTPGKGTQVVVQIPLEG